MLRQSKSYQGALECILKALSISPGCTEARRLLCGTKIHTAAYLNNVEEVQSLLNSGDYSLNDTNVFQHTVYHMAAYSGSLELLKLGGDTCNTPLDILNFSPAHYAYVT